MDKKNKKISFIFSFNFKKRQRSQDMDYIYHEMVQYLFLNQIISLLQKSNFW